MSQPKHLVTFLALRHIRRRPLQSTLTALGVTVGVMALIVALSLTNGFIDELLSSTLRATPHITVMPYDGALLADDAQTRQALQTPQLRALSPFIEVQALMARRADSSQNISGRQSAAQIIGMPPEGAREIFALEILQERQAELAAGDAIILGRSLARTLGVFEGDTVFIRTLTGSSHSFTVVGTFQVNNELIDSVVAYSDLATVQRILRAEGEISGYYLSLENPEDAAARAENIRAQSTYWAQSWDSVFGLLIEQMRMQKAVIGIVIALIVMVAAFGIANILVLTVSEKREEIAILRALGASRGAITRMFSLEALVLGGSGTLLGMVLGLAIAYYFRVQPFPLPGDLYFITQLPVTLQAWDIIWVGGMALLASWLAGVIPARRASRLDPADILR